MEASDPERDEERSYTFMVCKVSSKMPSGTQVTLRMNCQYSSPSQDYIGCKSAGMINK